jgi:hypothetical protein
MTKTPLLMGFLVYELNWQFKKYKNLPPNKLFYLSRCKNSNRNNSKRLKTIT